MENGLDPATLGAVTAGLTEMAKQSGLPSQFAPPLAVVIAIGVNCAHVAINMGADPTLLWKAGLEGLIVGLSTAGLYRIGKVFAKNARTC
jgi:Na+-transporting methylmalonyl-CoA/oxaloacetate decarboxylase beta subunit